MRNFTILLFCLFAPFLLSAQTVYVDADATGAADGSSWADAYADLAEAFANAPAGSDLWIAAGIYLPGSGSVVDTQYFVIDRPLNLYGGFDGTETAIDQADPANNVSVLSGDFNQDDIAGEFNLNKDDNARKILFIDTLAATTLNGLTISGADAERDPDAFPTFWTQGGGVYSFSTLTVENCRFTGNGAYRGASVRVSFMGAGSSFNNCSFNENFSVNRAAGVYGIELPDLSFTNCDFSNNTLTRGGIYLLRCDNAIVDNCNFTGNVSDGFNAGFYSWNGINVILSNSNFEGLSAANGASIYVDGRENDTLNLSILNCSFEGNQGTSGTGGGFLNNAANVVVRNTAFLDNSSNGSSGGAVRLGGECLTEFYDCTFERNEAIGTAWSGAVAAYGEAASFYRCNFDRNETGRNGGAILNAFGGTLVIDSCSFTNNFASASGGAVASQNDSSFVTITRTRFANNIATNNGGGVSFTDGVIASVDNCSFIENEANFGAAVSITADSALIDQVALRNLEIRTNTAQNQGGAFNLSNLNNGLIENVLAVENVAFGSGIGALLSNNATDNSISTVILRNVTAALNVANTSDVGGASIMQWEEDSTANATVMLQNVLLYEEIENYKIEQGTPTVVSMGGNIATDETMADVLTETTDQIVDTNGPMFADAGSGDFTLEAGSPAIDGGVDNGMLPATDLAGNPRVQGDGVDVGAYESSPVGTYDPALAEQFEVFPNPAADVVTVTLADTWTGRGELRVYDNQQRLLRVQAFVKASGAATQQLDLSALAAGNYHVVLQLADRHATQTVVRR